MSARKRSSAKAAVLVTDKNGHADAATVSASGVTTTSTAVPWLERLSLSIHLQYIYLPTEWAIFLTVTFIKLLLFPSYRSTDFDVHRNWLAITHSLPLSEWYTSHVSQWTLDYPPLFAAFEYAMSIVACNIDPLMCDVNNVDYASMQTILFQRGSVIVADFVLFYAVLLYGRAPAPWLPVDHQHSRSTLLLLSVCCPGLLFVDHIHFQYNGFLLGVFIMSLAAINNGNDLTAALLFAILLNLKHIFLYVAPVYVVYLFFHYVYQVENNIQFENEQQMRNPLVTRFSLYRFILLGSIVIMVFAISFGPFIAAGQLQQVISRLFPFKRGLSHAYWAPNVWAIYNAADLILSAMFKRMGHIPATAPTLTGGLVADITHNVLPTITPLTTLVLTVALMLPVLYRLYRNPHPSLFVSSIVYCSLCSFMLGWHVHEKAILMTLLPLTLLTTDSIISTRAFIIISFIGNYSLFPLLFTMENLLIKSLFFIFYHLLCLIILYEYHYEQLYSRRIRFDGLLYLLEKLYLFGFFLLFIFTELICPIFLERFKFLPLMLTSLYCAVGLIYAWYLTFIVNESRAVMLQSYVDG